MAATYDAKSSSLNNVNPTTITLSHVVAADATALFVLVSGWQANPTAAPTYNGVSMTAVGNSGNSNSNDIVYLYALAAPATGTHNISASFTGSCAVEVWGISWKGTPTAGGLGTLWADFTSTKTTVNVANSSISVPNNTANDGLVDALAIGTNAVPTMGTQTNRTLAASGSSAPAGEGGGASYLAPGPAGSQTMNWTFSSTSSAQAAVRVLGAAAATKAPPPWRRPMRIWNQRRTV